MEVLHFLIANFPTALESQNRRQSPVPINKQTNTPDKRCSVLELNFVDMKSSDPALSHLGCCLTQLISYLSDIRCYASS